jgi:hypothetical protein
MLLNDNKQKPRINISCVDVDLQMPIFTHGQLYVAVSHVTSKNGLKMKTVIVQMKQEM